MNKITFNDKITCIFSNFSVFFRQKLQAALLFSLMLSEFAKSALEIEYVSRPDPLCLTERTAFKLYNPLYISDFISVQSSTFRKLRATVNKLSGKNFKLSKVWYHIFRTDVRTNNHFFPTSYSWNQWEFLWFRQERRHNLLPFWGDPEL